MFKVVDFTPEFENPHHWVHTFRGGRVRVFFQLLNLAICHLVRGKSVLRYDIGCWSLDMTPEEVTRIIDAQQASLDTFREFRDELEAIAVLKKGIITREQFLRYHNLVKKL